MLIYVVSDRRLRPDLAPEALAEQMARSGADMIQIREKDLSAGAVLRMARRAVEACGAKVFVNGRPDVALAAGAAGVHLPAAGLPCADVASRWAGRLSVGVSTHSIEEAEAAARGGAGFVTFGPIYDTPSKRSFGPPQGLERLAEVVAKAGLPVLAIGGINAARMAGVARAGAAGVAVISAVLADDDLARAVRRLRDEVDS